MCNGAELRVHFTYDSPPPLETRFPLAEGRQYWRELHRCGQCGHYLEWFEADQSALYGGEYVSTTYGDPAGIRRTFDKINALPPERSDNIGRVRFVDGYCRARWPDGCFLERKPRLLDVGAGLGVFPYRMKQAGWDCTAMDMDERLTAHHRDVVGVNGVLGDVRNIDGIGEFDLVEVPARAENAEIGNHPTARADERDRLLRCELPVLIEPLVNLQLVAWAKERLDGFGSEMAVPGTDVHHEWVRGRRSARQNFAKPRIDRLPDKVLDDRPVRW